MIAIIIIGVFVLGFGYKASPEPNNFYEVYLDDKALGTIRSEEELSDYIDENGAYYKRKFNVDKVYSPKGLQVRKLTTYDGDVDSVSSIYNKISKKEKFTIKGYEFVIKKDLEESNEDGTPKILTQSIYVLDKSNLERTIEYVQREMANNNELLTALSNISGASTSDIQELLKEEIDLSEAPYMELNLYVNAGNHIIAGSLVVEKDSVMRFTYQSEVFNMIIGDEDTNFDIAYQDNTLTISYNEMDEEILNLAIFGREFGNEEFLYPFKEQCKSLECEINDKNAISLIRKKISFDLNHIINN